MNAVSQIDWYERRHELEEGQVFQSCYGLVKLEHQDGACLRDVGLRPLDYVDAVLKAPRVKVPARSDGHILFPVHLERRRNADRSRGQREAP